MRPSPRTTDRRRSKRNVRRKRGADAEDLGRPSVRSGEFGGQFVGEGRKDSLLKQGSVRQNPQGQRCFITQPGADKRYTTCLIRPIWGRDALPALEDYNRKEAKVGKGTARRARELFLARVHALPQKDEGFPVSTHFLARKRPQYRKGMPSVAAITLATNSEKKGRSKLAQRRWWLPGEQREMSIGFQSQHLLVVNIPFSGRYRNWGGWAV